MRNVKGISEIVLSGDPLPPFDYQCPLMSLPLAFNTEINSIPHEIKYLYVPIEATSQVKLELHKNNKKLRIGISWHSVAKGVGANRSIKLIELIQGINLDNIEFVNLQYGDVADEIEYVRHSLGINVIQSTVNNYDDIVGLAALIETCDLVVSIDNTTIHLAGALGKPTLVLLPFVADWRWLLDRNDSPWYPSLKLYRQNARGDWGNVLEKIKRDLVSLSTQEKLN
jgi:ADP-heptose:LPS heptosyltransferase